MCPQTLPVTGSWLELALELLDRLEPIESEVLTSLVKVSKTLTRMSTLRLSVTICRMSIIVRNVDHRKAYIMKYIFK